MLIKIGIFIVLPLLLLTTGCQYNEDTANLPLTKTEQNIIENYLTKEIIEPIYGGKIYCAYRVLLSDRQNNKIYLWAFIQEYYQEIGALQKGTGISVPVVLDVAEINGRLHIRGHSLPRTGNHFSEDVITLFPQKIREQIFKYSIEGIHELAAEIEAKVQAAEENRKSKNKTNSREAAVKGFVKQKGFSKEKPFCFAFL